MNKYIHFIIGFALVSCSVSDFSMPEQENQVNLNLNIGINENNTSRASITATKFSGSETVGIFVYKSDETTIYSANALNNPYQRDASATTWSSSAPIQLIDADPATIFSYYPYDITATDATAVPISVNSNQGTGQGDGTTDGTAQKDYMYGTKATATTAVSTVSINLNHALSLIVLKFKKSTDAGKAYTGTGNITNITLKNGVNPIFKTGTGIINIKTGIVTSAITDGNITIAPIAQPVVNVDAPDNVVPQILIFPTIVSPSAVFDMEVTIDGVTRTLSNIPAPSEGFKSGYRCTYNITVTKNAELMFANVTIQNWTVVPSATESLVSE